MLTKFFRFMVCASVVSLNLACNNDDDVVPEPTEQEIQAALNQKVFDEQIVGYGWKDHRMYSIDPETGLREKDMLGRDNPDDDGVDGGWYGGWLFEADRLTTYVFNGQSLGFYKEKITFDKEKNAVFSEGLVSVDTGEPIPLFQIESIKGDTLKAILYLGVTSRKNKEYDHFGYGIFYRLSTEGLKEIQEIYAKDLDI